MLSTSLALLGLALSFLGLAAVLLVVIFFIAITDPVDSPRR